MTGTVTSDRVVEIVGKLGAERIVEIMDTGASERELIEAKMLAQQREWSYAERPGLRPSVVQRVYEILRADLIDPQER